MTRGWGFDIVTHMETNTNPTSAATPVPTTTKHLTHAQTTAILHDSGVDWDDLVYVMRDTLAEFYDRTNGTRPAYGSWEVYSSRALRWAEGKVDRWAVDLNPAKDQ